MKSTCLLTRLFALVLVCILFSCQDHRLEPVTAPFRLKRVIQQADSHYSSYTLSYNSSGQLSSYVFRSATSADIENYEGQTTQLTYDAQGRLVRTESLSTSTSTTSLRQRRDYEYDNDNNLTAIKGYISTQDGSPFTFNYTETISNNSDKLPARSVLTNGSGAFASYYTYSGSNVVKYEYATSRNTTATDVYEYDNKPNPLYGFSGLAIRGFGPEVLSKNNRISGQEQLIYDSNGLLTTRVINNQLYPQRPGYVTYEYETIR